MSAIFVSELAGIITDETVKDVRKTLPYLGCGITRDVYDLGNVVLKVDRGQNHAYAGSCESEAKAWEQIRDLDESAYFAAVLASGKGWLIMEKVECAVQDGSASWSDVREVQNVAEYLGFRDLHSGNLGIRADGRVCVIDYAFPGSGYAAVSWDPEMLSDPCECGDHDCRDCYPDGCECCCSLHNWEGCEEYEGCNATYCEHGPCLENAVVHVEESGEWFGFRYGVIAPGCEYNGRGYIGMVQTPELRHWCEDHAPEQNAVRSEIPGQLGMWIRAGNFLTC